MILLVKIVLAHLIGDFVLQPESWVQHKEESKWKSVFLYLHAALHFGLVLLILGQAEYWLWALIIAGSHLLIDGIKLQAQRRATRRLWFFIDQALHLIVIGIIWSVMEQPAFNMNSIWEDTYWYYLTGITFLTFPTSVIMKVLMSKWSAFTDDSDSESLPDAGQYIGILERLFVFLFILLGEWGAIGFLLAAKSIFRFGDLTRAKDRKLTEYILIGTLLSFGIATLIGLILTNCT